MKRLLAVCSFLALAACGDKGPAYGDPNSIIAVMTPELWETVSEDVYDALEPTVLTVRDEKAFTVTYQDPNDRYWRNLKRFKQMLVVGTDEQAWVQQAIAEAPAPPAAGSFAQIPDVWSRGQTVTLLRLSAADAAGELRAHLAEIRGLLDEQYRAYARNRMYMSGVDTALADTLQHEAGFRLLLPVVYRWMRTDSTFVFRNDNPDPSELIRQIGVAWRSPAPATIGVDAVLTWRADLVASSYSEPQDFIAEGMTVDTVSFDDRTVLEIRAQWRNPPDRGWPAGGPLIARVVTCDAQDRTYLLDSWLYAPGFEKYEYMIQLETLLDTFECG